LAVGVAAALTGCAGTEGTETGSEVAAYLNGAPITIDEMEREAAPHLNRLENERYNILRATLRQMAIDRLIARAAESQGLTVEAYLKQEVNDKIARPTQEEVVTYYEANKSTAGGRTFEELMQPIFERLEVDRLAVRRDNLEKSLLAASDLSFELDAPRVEIPTLESEMVRGNADAPVTIVEYADFQCPYCRRAFPIIERLLAEYPDTVRYSFRDYPLNNHTRSRPAAQAARCAEDQGKFWDYFENLMVMKGDLSDTDLTNRAVDTGMDRAEFVACMQSERYSDMVEHSIGEAESLGVISTPTFFINGRMMRGAKPYDEFKSIVDEELALSASGGQSSGG
jgi:protein-disulfide isomerase